VADGRPVLRVLATRRMGQLGGHTILVLDSGGPTVVAVIWGRHLTMTRKLIEDEFTVVATLEDEEAPV